MDLTKPWAKSDLVLMVEEKPIYVNRSLLSLWSDPLDNLVNSPRFAESGENILYLPMYQYSAMLEFMKILHPPMSEVTGMFIH